ncbi:IQ and ubiquitin-like domain-containing protein [Anthonomus grandis grandis]|uniref:IQ and ubiquitin-like domain-containing protein n=1 Tax=Anthonomus grandis grandis TaxID=2921223 RepID=UPI0021667259|nr:IQ and ubiquitin-like domain-containing protein [Anthonomus grandis grandis]
MSLEANLDFGFLEKGATGQEEVLQKITVKFYTPDSKVFTQSFPQFYNIGVIKLQLSDLFGCTKDVISLLYKEEVIPDEARLKQFKPDKFGILEFKLQSVDRRTRIPIENAYKDLTVPDILTVKVENGNDISQVVVEIENKAIEKPYLGGYRDVNTGVQYHHGYTQTGPPKPHVPPEKKNHRDTQTYFTRNRKTEREYSRATQVATRSHYIPNICDKILTAGPYETADEREKRLDVEGKVRTIQRYFRAWQIKTRLKVLHEEFQKRILMEKLRDEKERKENEERRKKDLVSKVFPLKSEDFAMLYNMVDRWKQSEIQRITSMSCGAAKIAEFYLLLEKEIEILQSIERLRAKVKKDYEIKKVIDFFKNIGSPIEWDSDYKHIHISMDTLEAQKGREYFELFKQLCDKNQVSKEGRFEIYANLKDYLKTHQCAESQQIISLVDRACELMARGMSTTYISGLHKRIELEVLHHFKQQECNEGVTDHMKKTAKKHMTKNLIYCPSCQKLKPIESFTIHARVENMKTCTSCKWLDKADEPWIDLAPHKFILRQIRNYERLHHGKSSIAFILQDRDIHFIVTYIWHGHSALSECNDVYQLRLVRWKQDLDWSPWNCILLTLDEAKAHLRLSLLEDAYEKEFINHIFNKHALARKHFKHLTEYDIHFTEFAKGDPKLDETSDFYNRPNMHECDIDVISEPNSEKSFFISPTPQSKSTHPQDLPEVEFTTSTEEDIYMIKRLTSETDFPRAEGAKSVDKTILTNENPKGLTNVQDFPSVPLLADKEFYATLAQEFNVAHKTSLEQMKKDAKFTKSTDFPEPKKLDEAHLKENLTKLIGTFLEEKKIDRQEEVE